MKNLKGINHLHQLIFVFKDLDDVKSFNRANIKEALKKFRKLDDYEHTTSGVLCHLSRVFGENMTQSGSKRYTTYSISLSKEECIQTLINFEKVNGELVKNYDFEESYEARNLRNLYQIIRFANTNNNMGLPIVEVKSMFSSSITDYNYFVDIINQEYKAFSFYDKMFKLVNLPLMNLNIIQFYDDVDLDSMEVLSREYYLEWGGVEEKLSSPIESKTLIEWSRKLKEYYYILGEFYKDGMAFSNDLKRKYIKEDSTVNTYGLLKRVESSLNSLSIKIQFSSTGKNQYKVDKEELIEALKNLEHIYKDVFKVEITCARTISRIEEDKAAEAEAAAEEKKRVFNTFITKTVSEVIFSNTQNKMFASELKYRLSQMMINISGWDILEVLKTDERFSTVKRLNDDQVTEDYIIFDPGIIEEQKSGEESEEEPVENPKPIDLGYVMIEFIEKQEEYEYEYLTNGKKTIGGYMYDFLLQMDDKSSVLKLLEYYYASKYSDNLKVHTQHGDLITKCEELLKS